MLPPVVVVEPPSAGPLLISPESGEPEEHPIALKAMVKSPAQRVVVQWMGRMVASVFPVSARSQNVNGRA
jgi:hypothetical protein